MCGIAGLFRFDPRAVVPRGAARAMAETLVHRGPDDEGALEDGRVAFGFRRLAILDLRGGNQPILNEDGSVAVVFNGEIYNYRELRAELVGRRHRFATESDTEVLVHLYEEEGEGMVERLRGMFAFALLDRGRGRLLLARDRLGKKPLYYAVFDGGIAFASELKGLLALPSFPRRIDLEALFDFFVYRYVPTPKSIFAGARKLAPGHLLVADERGAGPPRPYWRLSFAEPREAPPARLAEGLRERFDEAVKARLVADVPLGAFLSGGIDSSAVVSAMARAASGPVVTCCVGFEDPAHDERAAAREVARALRTDHAERVARLDPALALERLPWHFDEPFADSSAVPTYLVSAEARSRVTVALSGDGGDENFAGYRRYRFDRLEGLLRRGIPEFLRRGVVAPIGRAWPKGDRLPRWMRAKTTLCNLADDPIRAYFRSVSACEPGFVREHFSGDLRRALGDYDPFDVFAQAHARADAPDPLGRILQADIATYLPDDILAKVDRASMAVSLEVRAPFLDHRVVEFAARIPTRYKIRFGRSKWILRRALRDRVPASALRRRKRGFDVPLAAWTRRELRGAVEEAVEEAPSEWFDREALRRSWRRHEAGVSDLSEFFWSLLVLERWRRRHGIAVG